MSWSWRHQARWREQDEWRIIFNTTHNFHLNHLVKTKDQVRCPWWPDVQGILEELVRDRDLLGVHFGGSLRDVKNLLTGADQGAGFGTLCVQG